MGAMVIGMVVVVANIKILIMSNDHSIVSTTVVIGSMIAYLISFAIVSNVLYTGGQLYAEFVPIFSTPMLHIGNILIIAATTTFDLAAEWHSRWRANMLRRFDYIKRLETELQKEEDSIIFVQQQVSVSHTP
jgi:phospholipid-transporting ATPase